MKEKINLFWFRRDLRIADNHGLYSALTSGKPVLPVFIYDTNILNDLNDDDSRVEFIAGQVNRLKVEFERHNSTLWIFHGKPLAAFKRLWVEYEIDTVYTNEDYEPYARERDERVQSFLSSGGVSFQSLKDQLIFHKDEIVKPDGKPYTVFTPYSKKWLQKLNNRLPESYPSEKHLRNLLKTEPMDEVSLRDLGFRKGKLEFPEKKIDAGLLNEYAARRDFPAQDGTSHLGIHLRFGTISIRQLTRKAMQHSAVFLNELIWRNFYMDILWHFPHVEKHAFKPAYDFIPWLNSEKNFARWSEGTTGYPLVDAGMRELNETGYMHNRIRMVTASFLCKHLLIDWRWGEAYFAEKLLDYELASNNGGWQWAAGTGCDAAPYFRVFNPSLQAQKFDPDLKYIRRWVPEFESPNYPRPIVDHATARQRAIDIYKKALADGRT
ncbi:cryptochrome/photolyase family protein [Sunxiuqinia dokdonensis]|uniref:Deoxyribodipyrimidine photo-lyase n=1 Tax=Sunxiuqinia dokdonensis TaxID=1409788 RepID=A0A0L8V9P0_9BACT|nr:deoxyribodipyrimidine photo-lyase [Sunxiuqinia dokdonensis]KOH45156.1 deoxyribodipyrimidine photo-lyase [Sunxiuqinia dokdonensis]